MTAGLQVYDQNGYLQMDSNATWFTFKTKLNVTIPTVTGSPYYRFPVYFTGGRPMVFLKGCLYFIDTITKTGSNTWVIWIFASLLAYQQVATIYIFDDVHLNTNFGLESYDENGKLVFSTASKPLKLAYAGQTPQGSERNPYNNGVESYSWAGLPPGSYAGNVSTTRAGLDVQGDDQGTYIDTMSEFAEFTSTGYNLYFLYDGNSIGTTGQWGRYFQSGPSPFVLIINTSLYD